MCVWVRDNASGVYYIISVLFIMSLNNVLFENERIHSVTLIFKIKARALISVQRRPSFLKSKAFIVAVMAQEVQQTAETRAVSHGRLLSCCCCCCTYSGEKLNF